jgi:hypothetical protein
MTFKFYRDLPSSRREREDNMPGAQAIVLLMMSLVFVPILAVHAFMLAKGHGMDLVQMMQAATIHIPSFSDIVPN